MSFSLLVIIFAAILWYAKLKKKNPDEAEKIERQVKDVMSGIELK